jgi:uncharacterized RDD family membrane protein YckC
MTGFIYHYFTHSRFSGNYESLILAMGFYLVSAPILEATPLQATPGKILLGLKVVSRKGKRLNILHSLFRSAMFYLSTLAVKITLWINLFSRDGKLLHDRLSASRVIRR